MQIFGSIAWQSDAVVQAPLLASTRAPARDTNPTATATVISPSEPKRLRFEGGMGSYAGRCTTGQVASMNPSRCIRHAACAPVGASADARSAVLECRHRSSSEDCARLARLAPLVRVPTAPCRVPSSLGGVDDDAEAHALPRGHPADAVAHGGPVGAPRPRHPPAAAREDARPPAREGDDPGAAP